MKICMNPLLFVSVSHAPLVESVRQSRSLWPITNECVNCLLLATLVGMRSAWAAGVHIHTHTHALRPTNRSVSSLVLFCSLLCSGVERLDQSARHFLTTTVTKIRTVVVVFDCYRFREVGRPKAENREYQHDMLKMCKQLLISFLNMYYIYK